MFLVKYLGISFECNIMSVQMCHRQTCISQPIVVMDGGGSTSSAGLAEPWCQWVCDPQDCGAMCCKARRVRHSRRGLWATSSGSCCRACFLECCLAAASSSGAEGSLRLASQRLQAACVLNAAACAIWTFSSSPLALSVSPSPLCSPPPASSLTEQLGRHWDGSSDINLSWCGMRGINIQRVM